MSDLVGWIVAAMATLLVAPPLLCAVVDGYRGAVLARAQADAIVILASRGGGREVPAVRDDLSIYRGWRLRAVACALLLGAAFAVPHRPWRRPGAPPSVEINDAEAKKKDKPCNPPCKSPQVCADGTCALPAAAPARRDVPPPGARHGFELVSGSPWIYDSLR